MLHVKETQSYTIVFLRSPSMGSETDNIADSGSNDVEYHETDRSYRTSFQAGNESVVNAITSTVAAATERDPFALPALYHTIDPDALVSILRSRDTETQKADVIIEFQYAGCLLKADCHGTLTVRSSSNR
jgi:hypothetical protein